MDAHSILFHSHISAAPEGRVVACNLGDAEYLGELAGRVRSILVFHRNHATLQSLGARLGSHGNVTISDGVFPGPGQRPFDLALIQVPKGRGFSRALLFTAMECLGEGGQLYAAGPNGGGANTALTDLETLTGRTIKSLATKARHRIFSAVRTGQIEAPVEWESPWESRERLFVIRGQEYRPYTQPGVFSYDHLDPGSELFVETILPYLADFPSGSRVLDAGCGCGIIGMAIQRELPAAEVVFCDVDLLALGCVRKTLPGATVIPADLMEAPMDGRAAFDLILCNPPFHQEHAKDISFMKCFAPHAARMMNAKGVLALVANIFLPYRELLQPHFNEVSTLARTSQYQVLVCRP